MKEFELYVITGENFHPGRAMEDVMEEAMQGGADIIQLRDKKSSKLEVLEKARKLRQLTYDYGVTFIVNDHIDVALTVDADGIHLGQDDLPLADARQIVGPDKLIGISTHAIEEAKAAEAGGADYIGAGPVFPTNTKEDVVDPVATSYVQAVKAEVNIPFVAIGGIKLHNVDEVLEAGAERICVVSEIVGAEDVKGTTEMFKKRLAAAKGEA
ncbi:thiamine-phosphate diphosphorylase [Salsuginibacillus halophilus]|uniref:Thiamine-phosphate synthase n=1 Tax=Salsuginibacillus halophilus TaxID=517424 RepID=A0A2P8H809_9BACI|nr:thiamine phosphate synthase [Salsuginibacillus halophilus]PSL42331.1 thiamine-phosphate diphosphorylase [Salsuginibacillus halophilus]